MRQATDEDSCDFCGALKSEVKLIESSLTGVMICIKCVKKAKEIKDAS